MAHFFIAILSFCGALLMLISPAMLLSEQLSTKNTQEALSNSFIQTAKKTGMIKTASLDPNPYFLPKDHALRPILDKIFSQPSVLRNDGTLMQSGFRIISAHKSSYTRVLTHHSMKGYVFKAYIESEPQRRSGFLGQDWLIRRCMGAEKIQKLIQSNNMVYFTVAKKWLYKVPNHHDVYVLIAQKMHIYSKEQSLLAWKTKVTEECLNEFFLLMKLGCASKHVSVNIPYTKEGKFAFIDTEYPESTPQLEYITHFLSPTMQIHWLTLLSK